MTTQTSVNATTLVTQEDTPINWCPCRICKKRYSKQIHGILQHSIIRNSSITKNAYKKCKTVLTKILQIGV